MLAMHMIDAVLSVPVAAVLLLIAAGGVAFASLKARARFEPERVPLMGVMGAFVFAAQMINFLILPGTTAHLSGGVLLAILLGPHAATLVMTSILVVQCLIFQDGGILALGANIINVGIVPCYLGYALFRALAGVNPRGGTASSSGTRLYLAVFAASFIGMLVGAALVPIQIALSGQLAVPFREFLLTMVGLHALVALGEAIITFLVIGYLSRVRPQSLGPVAEHLAPAAGGLSPRAVTASILVVALVLGGVVSLFASGELDALETITSVEEAPERALVRENPDERIAQIAELQESIAPLPDYEWTSLSGILGAVIVLGIVWGIGRALQRKSDASSLH